MNVTNVLLCHFILALLFALPKFTIAQDIPSKNNVNISPITPNSSEENQKVSQALEDLLKSMNLDQFTYQTEGRPDPFMPFISEKIIQSTEEGGETLTGMRQFEPGQLSLVAIVFTEKNPLAMVEDSSHKGYTIRRGTRIGKSGVVTDILPNEVIIKQLSYSISQEKKYTTVEMILRKEGEK